MTPVHASGPIRRLSAPTITATPAKPMMIAATRATVSRCRSQTVTMRTVHIGVVALRTAPRPAVIVCSAAANRRNGPPVMNTPRTANFRHSRRSAPSASPARGPDTISSAAAAIVTRRKATTGAGRSGAAIRMNRNEPPNAAPQYSIDRITPGVMGSPLRVFVKTRSESPGP